MKNLLSKYEVAIVGGGLAGLALAIQLSDKGVSVVLFEKEEYPFHKVCGEYISMESWDFIMSLGIPLPLLNLPRINSLQLTAANGKSFTTGLPLGGFGISRYCIDFLLYNKAKENGVTILEGTKVEQVFYNGASFRIQFNSRYVTQKHLEAAVCCGAYGKRSNLDIKWDRDFVKKPESRLDNYIAVKYHVHADWPSGTIGLHNFEQGYCGISQIEDGRYCLCYLTTAANLRKHQNSIPQMEKAVLYQNPALKQLLTTAKVLDGFPVTISQISFKPKTQVQRHVLMLGDASGMIAPLCGNGMSMALHSSKMATLIIRRFLKGEISRLNMEQQYQKCWQKEFGSRMLTGRLLQRFFGSAKASNLFVGMFRTFPFLAKTVIKKTHGKSF